MDPSISVVYLNPTKQLRAGIESLSQRLAGEANVSVLTPIESQKRINEHPDVEYLYYQARYVPGVRYTLPTSSFCRLLRDQIADADVVHAYSYFYPVCALTALEASRTKTPFIVSVDSLPGVNWSSGNTLVDVIARIYTETFGRIIFSLADQVVALGEYLVEPLSNYINTDQSLVIPNGIDIERFSPSTCIQHGKEYIKLLYVGRLDPVKGIRYLLEAVAILDNKFHLSIVGDGTRKQEYERLCTTLNIRDQVSFEGYQSDVISYYQSHDLFILPSLSEGQPTVLMEAQACGLPVISTDVGAASALVGAGTTVPPENAEQLAKIIESFNIEGDQLSEQARSHIVKYYSKENMCEKYMDLYNNETIHEQQL